MLQSPTLPAPVAEVTASTMAELIRTILADPDLTDMRRRNVASSIRRLCAALGLVPDQTPAALWFIRERLDRFHPAQAGMALSD